MQQYRRMIHVIKNGVPFVVLLAIGHVIKLSGIYGSYTAYFSGVHCVTPFIGSVMGPFLGGISLLFLGGTSWMFHGLHLKLYHIPSILASFYWSTSCAFFRIIIPLVCMILFIVHPVGLHVWFYSLYWIIPIVMSFIAHKNIFYKAIGTTFTAHAVGSVIWLYSGTVAPTQWITLIPIVFVERIILAIGLTGAYYLYKCMSNTISTYWHKKNHYSSENNALWIKQK